MSLPKSSAFRARHWKSKKNLSNAPFPLEVINSFGGYIRSSVAADHRGAGRKKRDGGRTRKCDTTPERPSAFPPACMAFRTYPKPCRTATSADCHPPGPASAVLYRTKIITDAAGQDRPEQERGEAPCAAVPESSVDHADGFHTGGLCDNPCLDPSRRHEIQEF